MSADFDRVAAVIRPLPRALVAYSGGVDSTTVLAVGREVLGAGCSAVIARSPSLPAAELSDALELARHQGVTVTVLETGEVDLPAYRANGPDRCYFCKAELYGELGRLGEAVGATVLDGFNRDDRSDWRPGRRAAREHGVRSPLDEAGLGKQEVRRLARELGLPNWDKPQAACLSSRVPTGVPITIETLARVEAAEAIVKRAGFRQVRVRDDRAAATIEVGDDETGRLLADADLRRRLERELTRLGYASVAIDPSGYHRGAAWS